MLLILLQAYNMRHPLWNITSTMHISFMFAQSVVKSKNHSSLLVASQPYFSPQSKMHASHTDRRLKPSLIFDIINFYLVSFLTFFYSHIRCWLHCKGRGSHFSNERFKRYYTILSFKQRVCIVYDDTKKSNYL